LTKSIYVGNLPFTASDGELRDFFAAHGNVINVSLPTDRETGRPRGFAFVEMDDGDADGAINALDGAVLGGRTLRVNEARSRDAGPPRDGGDSRGAPGESRGAPSAPPPPRPVALEVGQQAPDFTLADEENRQITLSDMRGSVIVLLFYSFDFSGICQAELCDVRDNYSSWQAAGAHVYGVSRDSRFAHAAFKEQQNFSHSLLADVKGDVARAYGTWNDQVGAAERLTVVIDREGKVAHMQKNAIPDQRDHTAVESAISAIA
jgi:peroxiredoxin